MVFRTCCCDRSYLSGSSPSVYPYLQPAMPAAVTRKKPVAAVKVGRGRSAAMKSQKKRKTRHVCLQKKHPPSYYTGFKYIIQVDESHLNKKKPGKLTKDSRPQKDQIWVASAVLQGYQEKFCF